MNLKDINYKRASVENVYAILNIIVRCMKEVNYKDYTNEQFNKYLSMFTKEWLTNIITTRHYYEAWYDGEIIAAGGVSRDYRQDKQSYFTAIFVNPDFHGLGVGKDLILFLEQDEWCLDSNLIEIPSSKSSHGFYYKLGYQYRTNPPIFNEDDGSTIMYKYRQEV
ncbi:GNAT family N-acetyltransferase [Clostridium intestinale]|uniref:N-acetyltransferase GCN5 n=2 Tax=Clostridium intestinale TaxID=36845 RepID=U2Q415_9CLOT|nr:GNAT family N-acetyltransferase [Clostridium intestinale]ERK30839.1 N-acetyltransferase GCN5 [Clostridium intestinale URNW]QLY81804.1 GNAT family N-acetyltransferase [Clostridium intestinale]